jgi:dynein heavy chain
MESRREEIFCEMPIVRLVPVPEEEMEGRETYSCPMFQNSERSGDDNYVINLELPTEEDPDTWVLRGVALLNQQPKDG